MSICKIGLDAKLKSTEISILVPASDPLIQLANALNWQEIALIVLPDLQQTAKGFWWLGRKLGLRVHLGALILQVLFKETDRGIESRVKQTPVYQLFCGFGIIPGWKCPDHTKIEEFRNRLKPETHKKIGDHVLRVACRMGFSDPSWMDVDSTVQEANMSYPSDANLLKKISLKVNKVAEYLKAQGRRYFPSDIKIDIKGICKKAQAYFFLSKKTDIEKKRAVFNDYFCYVKHELAKAIQAIEALSPQAMTQLPWNIAKDCSLIKDQAWRYLLDVAHFTREHSIKPGKRLCFHLSMVACISKGKLDKKNEFGRQFQLGRIGGNFLIPLSNEVKMEDKKSLVPMVENHIQIFGQNTLKEVGTDKGYYTHKNIKSISAMGINTDGIQRPANAKKNPPKDITDPLRDRRAGIEPLIGHLKSFGLRKSKMKSDVSTHSSVYRCTMGFNLHQLQRYLTGAAKIA